MKIIYITNARIPTEKAHGYQICKMCEEFSNNGMGVELWIPDRDVGQIEDNAFSFYGLKSNFKIKKIDSSDLYKHLKYPGKFLFWLQGFWFILYLLFTKVDKKSVIYSREPEISWLFSLRGYYTVYEAHTWPENRVRLFLFLIKKTKKIITITHSLENLFIKAGYPKNNILTAPDGVDLSKFDIDLSKTQAREKLDLPPNKKIILYTGHLYSWKGVDILARAASQLSDECLVTFVGGVDTDVDSFRQKNKELVASGRLAIYQHQRRDLIPLWLKAANVLVLPNRSQENISKYFTSPLKLFEYMASQRPVVASDLPSLREVLNEKNCVFFKPDDAKDLAGKIVWTLENQETADKIAMQAYRDVKKYDWGKRAGKIINFICEK